MVKKMEEKSNNFYTMDINIMRVERELDSDKNEKRVLLVLDKNTKGAENLYMALKPFITEYSKKVRKH